MVNEKVLASPDRIRYALQHVNRAKVSWSARELFFLVKIFFPTETRSSVSQAAATLCTSGDLSISGRRYKMKAPKPVHTGGATRKDVIAFHPLPPHYALTLSGTDPICESRKVHS